MFTNPNSGERPEPNNASSLPLEEGCNGMKILQDTDPKSRFTNGEYVPPDAPELTYISTDASEIGPGGENKPVPIVPDFGMAREHLTWLDPNAKSFTFQVFDDKQGAKRKQQRTLKLELAQEMGLEPKQKLTQEQKLELESRLKQKLELRPELKVLPATIIHGSFDSVKDQLATYNKRRYGIFVTVNETDGKGRSTENIIRVRAVYQERDGDGTIDEDQVERASCILGPSISVQSSLPTKIHDWFLCDPSDPLPVEDYEGIQRRMIKSHGSCEDAKDLARVLRVAGFFHCKYAPIMSRLISEDGERYSSGMLKLAFPPIPRTKSTAQAIKGDLLHSVATEALVRSWSQ